MALFGETIRNTIDGIFQLSRAAIETIVMQHEVGHIIELDQHCIADLKVAVGK